MNQVILLVGNPNVGKSTLFNRLTGKHQKVANWPGVTIEVAQATVKTAETEFTFIDCPGIYDIFSSPELLASDQKITQSILQQYPDAIIVNVVDVSHLERNLFLTTQLRELQRPMIMVLTRSDLLAKNAIFSTKTLSQHFDCQVLVNSADFSKDFFKALLQCNSPAAWAPEYPSEISALKKDIFELEKNIFHAMHDLTENSTLRDELSFVIERRKNIQQQYGEDIDILCAQARFGTAKKVSELFFSEAPAPNFIHLDRYALHPVWGIPIFIAILFGFFTISIDLGNILQSFLLSTLAPVVSGVQHFAMQLGHVGQILLTGLMKGALLIVAFIPMLFALYFCLSFLEGSGYLARATGIVDRGLKQVGLPGSAFVPLILGFGCNVPAILGTRILEQRRDRLLAALLIPFMPCSARLAIYTVFAQIFFPQQTVLVIFSLYLLGIVLALLSAALFSRYLFSNPPTVLLVELPPYLWPGIKDCIKNSARRVKEFVQRAGSIILPFTVLFAFLEPQHSNLLGLQQLGHSLQPLLAPMGITPENWPAGIALLSGALAKEGVIATLNALYDAPLSVANAQTSLQLSLPAIDGMLRYFGSAAAAYAYLVFTTIYVPCVSTVAATLREHGWKLAMLSVLWNTFLAYAVAVIVYQSASLMMHVANSLFWIVFVVALLVLVFAGIKWKINPLKGDVHAAASS